MSTYISREQLQRSWEQQFGLVPENSTREQAAFTFFNCLTSIVASDLDHFAVMSEDVAMIGYVMLLSNDFPPELINPNNSDEVLNIAEASEAEVQTMVDTYFQNREIRARGSQTFRATHQFSWN